MSEELKHFFRELWAWVQGGFPDHEIFKIRYSLCHTADRWFTYSFFGDLDVFRSMNRDMEELFKQIYCANLKFPFNTGYVDWRSELLSGDFYQNPKRLAFIEEHAK